MARLVTDVLDFLGDQGIIDGGTGWTGFAGYLPPDPDQVIVVYETPGSDPELIPAGSVETAYDEPGFQVRGRGAEFGYAALRDKMGAIYRALHGSELAPASGDPAYVLVRAVQSAPLPLGLDDNSRPHFTWNFLALRERGGD